MRTPFQYRRPRRVFYTIVRRFFATLVVRGPGVYPAATMHTCLALLVVASRSRGPVAARPAASLPHGQFHGVPRGALSRRDRPEDEQPDRLSVPGGGGRLDQPRAGGRLGLRAGRLPARRIGKDLRLRPRGAARGSPACAGARRPGAPGALSGRPRVAAGRRTGDARPGPRALRPDRHRRTAPALRGPRRRRPARRPAGRGLPRARPDPAADPLRAGGAGHAGRGHLRQAPRRTSARLPGGACRRSRCADRSPSAPISSRSAT